MAQVVLLDTHTLVWLVLDKPRLSRAAQRAIDAADRVLVADISLREIAWLYDHDRLELDDEPGAWLRAALSEFKLEVVPISPEIAQRSNRIAQNFHGDPADQLIAATAIELGISVITIDDKMQKSPAVPTIW